VKTPKTARFWGFSRFPAVLLAVALAVACSPGQARPDTAAVPLGHEFVLAGGQSAVIDGSAVDTAPLRLKFDRVLDD